MTISQLIDALQDIYNEHGDVPVLDGKKHDFHARTIEIVKIDDWDNLIESTPEGDIPGIGHAVAIGPRF